MKKRTILSLVTALLLLLCLSATAEGNTATLVEAVNIEESGLTIAVDPRLELLSIVQYIGRDNVNVQWGLMTRIYTQYKNDIDNYFRQFDEHPAVAYFDRETNLAAEADYGFDEPVGLIVLMRDDFTVDSDAFAHHLETFGDIAHWNTLEKAQEFFDLLRDFYADTGFEGFYNDHRAYYENITQTAAALLPEENLIGYVEDFFGQGADGYVVNLVTLFHSGGFGGESIGSAGHFIYANIGPENQEKHIPTFRDTAYFTELEIHEFGHSFLPIAGETDSPFAPAIEDSAYLFPAVEVRMGEHAYGSWDTVLEETVLRACVVRIMEQYDAEHAAQLLREERDAGFTYIDSVYASLQTYLDNRDGYPTIVSFLPVVFEQLAADHPA
ncbi:DUF4932 domain-containing protein [Eubacteriales bacterium OttesenSCG-928-A19]|nr:DUF4932 domain-containing protein [Eubacteriales bacterium OttesenSCG-928-A19]